MHTARHPHRKSIPNTRTNPESGAGSTERVVRLPYLITSFPLSMGMSHDEVRG